MTRRLLGPVGGPILFFCVAALVFAGLGWVTVAALRVEKSQRESAARHEQETNVRIALWKLDCRMLPTLGVEDARPYYHFSPGDVSTSYGPASAPLLAAELPEWMQLHVQIDPDADWDSPQVVPPETVERLRQLWPDLNTRNVTPERAARLSELRDKYPARGLAETLAARERATPADSPLATGLFNNVQEVEPVQQHPDSDPMPPPSAIPNSTPPPVMTPAPLDDEVSLRLFNFNWALRRDGEGFARRVLAVPSGGESSEKKELAAGQPPPQPMVMQPPAGRVAGVDAVNNLANSGVPAPRPVAQAPPQLSNPGAQQLGAGQQGGRGGAGNRSGEMATNYSTPRAKTISEAVAEATRGGRAELSIFGKGQSQLGFNPPGLPNTPSNPSGTTASPAPGGQLGGGGFNGGIGGGGVGSGSGASGFGGFGGNSYGTPGGGSSPAPPAGGAVPFNTPTPGGSGPPAPAESTTKTPPPGSAPARGTGGPPGAVALPPVLPVTPATTTAPPAAAPPGMTLGSGGGNRPGGFGGAPRGAPAKGDKQAKDLMKEGVPNDPTSGVPAKAAKPAEMAGGFFRGEDPFAQKKYTEHSTGAAEEQAGKLNQRFVTEADKDSKKGGAGAGKDDLGKGAKAAESGDEKKLLGGDGKEAFYDRLQAFRRRATLAEQERAPAGDKPADGAKGDEAKPVPLAEPKAEARDNRDRGAIDAPAPVPAPEVIPMPPPVAVHLGSMRPQWLPVVGDGRDELVLVRTAKVDGKTIYQGVVLDWAKLEEVLRDEIKGQLPGAKLVPVRDPAGVSPERAMASLPVQLDPGPLAELPPTGMTPLRLGLILAWVAAFIAFAAVGLSGWSLIDSSERRIRFVSAVTHELRTPLTSLRLYIDLLLSGMVQDEEKRKEYLATLNVESDRLHRLIDNVLDFARLEGRRRKTAEQPTCVGELLELVRQTWGDRCGNDGKELIVISTLSPEQTVCTDVHLVQQIVGNLIDNARKYTRDAADQRIWLWAKPDGARRVVFEVEDRGPGVPPRERRSIFHPFRRGDDADSRAGGAGLGLALAKQWAEALGGRLTYRPADGGTGACFRLELRV